jgi:hypothetical protein
MRMKPLRTWQEVRSEWASELAEKLGRSVEEIKEDGLTAFDFTSSHSVEIRYIPDLLMRFDSAFALIRPERNEAAIFTEHHGYLEFELFEDTSISEISTKYYQHNKNQLPKTNN